MFHVLVLWCLQNISNVFGLPFPFFMRIVLPLPLRADLLKVANGSSGAWGNLWTRGKFGSLKEEEKIKRKFSYDLIS